MIGAMIIFTRLINPSPRGFNPFPKPGFKYPTTMPRNTAIRTWTYKIRYHGLRRADTWMGGFVMGEAFLFQTTILLSIRSAFKQRFGRARLPTSPLFSLATSG